MHSIAHEDVDEIDVMSGTHPTPTRWRSEPPTRPVERVTESVLMLALRIERLAELAAERLASDPDEDAIAAVAVDLVQIRELARQVPR